MNCAYCGLVFNEATAPKGGCHTCISNSSSCGMVKCPRCGYDTPEVPKWAKRLNAFVDKGVKLVWGK